MERFSQRETVLLGYDLHSQFGNSDCDFKDVFGGPPRRFSHQEIRNSLGETAESKALRGEDDLPVFGEDGMSTSSRRRHTSNDFFDDIFGGNDSLTSSPRKNERNSFSAASASRVSSPVRPLPPRADAWISSVPAQFSLPAKLVKGTDLPAFISSSRNHHKNKDIAANGASSYTFSPLSRFSSKAPEGLTNDVSRQSSLLEELSLNGEENLTQPVEADKGIDLKGNSDSSEVPANDSQFHFSIYKWASKGAPFAMSLRRGNKSRSLELSKLQRCSSANGWISCEDVEIPVVTPQDIKFPSSGSHMPSKAKSIDQKSSHLDTSIEGRVEEYPILAEGTLSKIELGNLGTDHVAVGKVPPDTTFHGSTEGTLFSSVPDKGSSGKTEDKVSATRNEVSKYQLKTLRSLLRDKNHEQDAEDVTLKNGLKESKVKSSKKISAVFDSSENLEVEGTKTASLSGEVNKASLQGSPINSRDSPANNRVRGKVKEFVKIFNQETPNKPKVDAHSQNQSSKWRERSKITTMGAASVTTARENEKKNDKPDASISTEYYFKEFEKLQPETKTKHEEPTYISAGLNDSSAASSVPDVSRASAGDASEPGNFLVTELTQVEDKPSQTGTDNEKLQDIEAKIKKWSNGKEGNIRSLLSTLQYVLWSESGWKSVPLVDIIEGNAVKRSYQKALLCLHPDKLQQKGATADQKYIAEKVFGVLQEAWDHFSLLGAVL